MSVIRRPERGSDAKPGFAENCGCIFGCSGKPGQNRFKELRRRGVAKFAAAVAARSPTGLWRVS